MHRHHKRNCGFLKKEVKWEERRNTLIIVFLSLTHKKLSSNVKTCAEKSTVSQTKQNRQSARDKRLNIWLDVSKLQRN